MDPIFERRELSRTIHIEARHLQRNMQVSLTTQLRSKYEGKCVAEGYIMRESIAIVEYSLGRTNLIKGGLDYLVRFQADICMPHKGQHFRAPVVLKSKIGIHAELTPLKILLPRDLHIGNSTFEDIKEKQEIEFEVVGTRFQQGDDRIVVLGTLREIIRAAVEEVATPEATSEPLIAAPVFAQGQDQGQRKMVTVDVSTTKPSADATRRARIKTKPTEA
jgi:DNA-directed RNA polymerase subunit E'/Rpb7